MAHRSGLSLACVVLALVATVRPVNAQQDSTPGPRRASKSAYTLFRPTPPDLLREFATDRPDKTESPYTVDAGHLQVETDLITMTRDRVRGPGVDITNTSYGIVPVNIKFGLRHNVDVQFVLEPVTIERMHDRITPARTSWTGQGDFTTRVKVNLWGNDGGKTALGLMPFATLARSPSGDGRYVAGGLIVPLAVELGGGFGLGAMTEFDIGRADVSDTYRMTFVNSVTVGRDIARGLGMYTELYTEKTALGTASWIVTFDVGTTYALAPNVQLDAGLNVGLTAAADGANPFLGLSFRR